jgi:superfamily II DNA or RNA helicase
MARQFSRKQRDAVSIVTGRHGDADHIIPHSSGGSTSGENCQMLGSNINRRKGSFVYKPREWQEEFHREWDARKKKSFLMIVIPAGGKTMAALETCRRWMAAGTDRRIVVVVPTDNLREQWREEAVKFGIDLQSKEFGTNFKDGFQGGVTTYSFVANNSAMFRKLCSVAPTMVVFDEIHHCGDEAHFGRGIVEAFEHARERLLLSGTPWKTDGTAIPYVTYDGSGYAIGDFFYDYPRALNESVVRYLVFDYSRGTITNDVTGSTQALSSEVSDDEASRVLLRILDPRGAFVREQIRQAHQKLLEVRNTTPDAGALAACVDQNHAIQIAETIRSVTGCTPSLIVSDQSIENDTVRDFRKSRTEWLVAVRKVSEGTDIKRLQVLCYLTNTVTELFFRQLIGRVSRYRDGEDREGYVFLPADPRLIRCAQNIENAQVQAVRDQEDLDLRERQEERKERPFESFSTAHDGTEVVMIGSEPVPGDQAEKIRCASEKTGVPMQKVLEVLRFAEGFSCSSEQPQRAVTKEEEMDSLRDKCQKKAWQLARVLVGKSGDAASKVKEIHLRFRPQGEMTEDELRRKLSTLIEEIKRNA